MLVLIFMYTHTAETSTFLYKEIPIYAIWMKLIKVIYLEDSGKPHKLTPKVTPLNEVTQYLSPHTPDKSW